MQSHPNQIMSPFNHDFHSPFTLKMKSDFYLHESQPVILQRLVKCQILERRILKDGEKRLRLGMVLEQAQKRRHAYFAQVGSDYSEKQMTVLYISGNNIRIFRYSFFSIL